MCVCTTTSECMPTYSFMHSCSPTTLLTPCVYIHVQTLHIVHMHTPTVSCILTALLAFLHHVYIHTCANLAYCAHAHTHSYMHSGSPPSLFAPCVYIHVQTLHIVHMPTPIVSCILAALLPFLHCVLTNPRQEGALCSARETTTVY